MPSENGLVRLSDLSDDVYPVELVAPSGKRVTVRMRALKHSEIKNLRRRVTFPTPPVADIRRNPQGQMERVYNEQDPTYLAATGDSNDRLVVLGVLLSTENLEVPGETDEEKVAAFQDGVDAWASLQLCQAFNRVNGYEAPEMAEAKANLNPFAEGSSPSSPASGGDSPIGEN